MKGIGVDLVEIARIKNSIARPGFLTRYFGARELEQYAKRGGKASFIAANFCAKEAFSKALGTGVRGFALREVELLRDALGKPYLVFSGEAARLIAGKNLEFEASVSHTKEYAVAVVAAHRKGDGG